jgi:BON domain
MKNFRNGTIGLLILAGLLAAMPALAWADAGAASLPDPAGPQTTLEHQVSHQLLMLPYYGVFDNLEFQVNGSQVVLSGQVVRPTLKYDAANVVRRIPGVTAVTNNIQVLPFSRYDDWIRLREYRAVFGRDSLYRYALGANPSIHIIVDNGHVTLMGVVSNRMDSIIANLAANQVPGVFSVTNNLRVL